METRSVVILGSGCAGLTAAVYAARANLKPLLIDGHEAGGQLSLTTDVENYPGFPKGILGPDLIENMRKQAARFGTDFLAGAATAADLKAPAVPRHRRRQAGGQGQHADHRLRCLGRMIGLESEKRLLGRGVSTCATCDGFFFKGKDLVVVGGGDSAMEEGTFLTKFASKVTVVHRRDALRASKIMQDRAHKNPKIAFRWDTTVEDVLGDEKVEGVRLKNHKTGKDSEMKVSGCSWRSATCPTRASSRASSTWTRQGTS